MNYHAKYLKYKSKYMSLRNQFGGDIYNDFYAFGKFSKTEFTNPRNIVKSGAEYKLEFVDESLLRKCEHIKDLFGKVCSADYYDRSMDIIYITQLETQIKQYIGLEDDDLQMSLVVHDAFFSNIAPSQLRKDYNTLCENPHELQKCLEYLRVLFMSNYPENKNFRIQWSNHGQDVYFATNIDQNSVEPIIEVGKMNNMYVFVANRKYYYPVLNDGGKLKDIHLNTIDASRVIRLKTNKLYIYETGETKKNTYAQRIVEMSRDKTLKCVVRIVNRAQFESDTTLLSFEFKPHVPENVSDLINAVLLREGFKFEISSKDGKNTIYVNVTLSPHEMNAQKSDEFLVYDVPESDLEEVRKVKMIGHVTNLFDGHSTGIDMSVPSTILSRRGVTPYTFNEYISDPLSHIEDIKEKFGCDIIKYLIFNKRWDGYDTIFNRLDMWESAMGNLHTLKTQVLRSLTDIVNDKNLTTLGSALDKTLDYERDWKKFLFDNNNLNHLGRLFGMTTSNYDSTAFSSDIIVPQTTESFHIGYLYGMDKITFMGALSHENGHHVREIAEIKNYFAQFYPENDGVNYFSGVEENATYGEFLADVFSMIYLDAYLAFEERTNDQNFEIIREWFRWNCTKTVTNKISVGHPHHQFRHNTLLISKRVFNIVCEKFPHTEGQ